MVYGLHDAISKCNTLCEWKWFILIETVVRNVSQGFHLRTVLVSCLCWFECISQLIENLG